jgi:hypothetical protein
MLRCISDAAQYFGCRAAFLMLRSISDVALHF